MADAGAVAGADAVADSVRRLEESIKEARQDMREAKEAEAKVAADIEKVEQDLQAAVARMAETEGTLLKESAFHAAWEGLGGFGQRRHKNDLEKFKSSLGNEQERLERREEALVKEKEALRAEKAVLLAARERADKVWAIFARSTRSDSLGRTKRKRRR